MLFPSPQHWEFKDPDLSSKPQRWELGHIGFCWSSTVGANFSGRLLQIKVCHASPLPLLDLLCFLFPP